MDHRMVNGFRIIFGALTIIVLLLLLGGGWGGQGETITVDDDGGVQYTSIQAAIDNATEGDTIRVFAGEYNESLTINKSLSIIGNGSETTFIYFVNESFPGSIAYFTNPHILVHITANDTTISGFEFLSIFRSYDFFSVTDVDNCTISHNTFSLQSFVWYPYYYFGSLRLVSSSNISIFNNTFNPGKSGITGNYLEKSIIHENIFMNGSGGIILFHGRNNTIRNNIFEHPPGKSLLSSGITLSSSHGTTIHGNTLINTGYGIYIENSTGTRITGNYCENDDDSITLSGSTNQFLADNTMIDSGIAISGDELQHWNTHDIDGSNTIRGQGIRYIINLTNQHITNFQGPVIIANCHNLGFEGLNCSNGTIGFLAGYSSNIIITNSSFTNNSIAGISLIRTPRDQTRSHVIRYSTFTNNGDGISIAEAGFAIIENNIITGNHHTGIEVHGDNATIAHNLITNNTHNGIEVHGDNTTIIHNTITNNSYTAIGIVHGRNQTIAYNNCSNNERSGISILSSDGNNITGNICNNNDNGIILHHLINNSLSFNICNDNRENGIKLDHVSYNILLNNSCGWNNESGIMIDYCHDNMLLNNSVSNNSQGIYLTEWTYYNTLIGNVVVMNECGIRIGREAVINTIRNNAIVNNRLFGIKATEYPIEEITVSRNWWGHPSGPFNSSSNINGRGDNVSGGVDYSPWLREWSDPSLVRDPGDENEETDDDDNDGFGRLILSCLLIILFFLILTLVIIIYSPDIPVMSTDGLMQKQAERKKDEHPGPWRKQYSSFRSPGYTPPPPPAPSRSTCPNCGNIMKIDPHQPAIRITCPRCGEEYLSDRFKPGEK